MNESPPSSHRSLFAVWHWDWRDWAAVALLAAILQFVAIAYMVNNWPPEESESPFSDNQQHATR